MTISTIQQSVEVSDVDLVVITEATEDTENSVWVREIRAYDVAASNGAQTLLFTLRLTATTEDGIALTAPAQTF